MRIVVKPAARLGCPVRPTNDASMRDLPPLDTFADGSALRIASTASCRSAAYAEASGDCGQNWLVFGSFQISYRTLRPLKWAAAASAKRPNAATSCGVRGVLPP